MPDEKNLKNNALLELIDIRKVYAMGENDVVALDGVSACVNRGEYVAIMGSSGSGKSTLMHIIGCLDAPSSGYYRLNGLEVASLSQDDLAHVRNNFIGFVFQGFNLLPRTTAVENVELPLLYRGTPPKKRRELAMIALEQVGLAGREFHFTHQLSGGQQQRVAIARGIVGDAPLILADEPTGNLDSKNSSEIMELFCRLNVTTGVTIALVTHELDMAQYARRVITLKDGLIIKDAPPEKRRIAQ